MSAPAPTRYLADPPEGRIRPIKFGIFSVAEMIDENDPKPDHWENGLSWEPYSCGPVFTTGADCPPEADVPEKTFDDGGTSDVEALPFWVYAPYKCSMIGREMSQARTRARRRLEAGEERAVEAAIANGLALGNAPVIASAGAEDLTPAAGALSIKCGIAALEDYLGNCGGGILHMTRGLAFLGFGAGVRVDKEDPSLLSTNLGTPVSAGAGYDLSGPDGTPVTDGESWIYATAPVTIWRGPIMDTPPEGEEWAGVDRKINNIMALAERPYVAGWDACCHAAVRVNIDC